ncbi:LamG domain-containing protein [Candidatus Poribacteria bacterium]
MIRNCVFASMMLFLMIFATKAMALPDPQVYFTFDVLGDPVDDSGNGNNGTLKGAVALNDDGKVGKCFEFNGLDAYVELKNVTNENFTHMCWIKADTPGHQANAHAYGGSGLIWSDVGGANNDYASAVLGTKFAFFVGTPNTTVTSTSDVTTGEWVHVAAARSVDTGDFAIYVNGVLEGTVEGHANKNPLTGNPLNAIGANPLDNRYYTGLIDEVKLFNVVLTVEEIQQIMEPVAVASEGKLTTTWGEIKRLF